jgi:cytochrome c peroxidase
MKKILLLSFLAIVFLSCLKPGADIEIKYYDDEDYEILSRHLNIPQVPDNYQLVTPSYIANNFFGGGNNNDAEVLLGRVLFYDKNLSKDRKISCASCHDQKLGFGDKVAFSKGANNKATTRNSLALGSVLNFSVYYGDERFGRVPFFWDNSATTVQEQSKRTLGNPNEMDMHMTDVVKRVKELEYYKPLFKYAYSNNQEINEQSVLNAISGFVNAIPAYHTKWDTELEKIFNKKGSTLFLENEVFSGYTEQENHGKNLYLKHCGSCHGSAIGSPDKTRANNGLYTEYTDNGIGAISGVSNDVALFKVPTLRNILLSAPYMHDGSLATIDDVLDHYSNGIKNHKNLDPLLKSGNAPKKLNFTQEEREALKAFFNTLTDYRLLSDIRFSDPFKK